MINDLRWIITACFLRIALFSAPRGDCRDGLNAFLNIWADATRESWRARGRPGS